MTKNHERLTFSIWFAVLFILAGSGDAAAIETSAKQAFMIDAATGLSRKIDLHRVTIQNMLSDRGNPRLDSLGKVLAATGLKLMVGPMDESPNDQVSAD